MRVVPIERKSTVLTRSSLACLANVATINLTAGCAHRCVYCYTRGYANSPREGAIHLYANTAAKLREELKRKRRLPQTVYFSPSSDLFQPVPAVLELALETLGILFEWRVGVTFLSKGRIPRSHMDLMKANASLVEAQVGLTSLDERILGAFEPNAAPPQVRLEQTKELVDAAVATTGRLDPILPGLTDDEATLRGVCSAFAEAGVSTLAASTLFLRPAVTGSLMKNLRDERMRERLLDAFARGNRLAIHAQGSSITALPQQSRREIYAKLRSEAAEFGLDVRVCACKNPDIASGSCYIAGRRAASREATRQIGLF